MFNFKINHIILHNLNQLKINYYYYMSLFIIFFKLYMYYNIYINGYLEKDVPDDTQVDRIHLLTQDANLVAVGAWDVPLQVARSLITVRH